MSENKRVKKNDVYTFLLLKQVCTMNIQFSFSQHVVASI